MIINQIISGKFGIGMALALGRVLPPRVGYHLADAAASWMSRRPNIGIVQALRSNIRVSSGFTLTYKEINSRVLKVLQNNNRALFDFYHYMKSPQEILNRVEFSAEFQPVFAMCKNQTKPVVFVAPHTSNFDLAGQALALRGLRVQILSYPQPPKGYQWQNQLRAQFGLEITPMSIESMRLAKKRLKEGGSVLTGLDRPMKESNYPVRFFGYPALLPVSHVRLAIETGADVVVVACITLPDGRYQLTSSGLIPMHKDPDRKKETILNTERVLFEAEKIIKRVPDQWSMFYPIWPEFIDDIRVE